MKDTRHLRRRRRSFNKALGACVQYRTQADYYRSVDALWRRSPLRRTFDVVVTTDKT